jgi:hypothetical protein
MKSHVTKSIKDCFRAKDFIKVVDEHLLSSNKALTSTLIKKSFKEKHFTVSKVFLIPL